jgi:hypothetical protein
VSIPNLVEHAQTHSLLLNDLLHGVREAAVFAGDQTRDECAFSDVVADPPGHFPAAALRKMMPYESLHETADHLTPFCRTALESGLGPVSDWPDLAALWRPRQFDIRPLWAES